MKIVWSPLALDRVGEIADYIARDKTSAASEWVEAVFTKAARLVKFPESGRIVPEIKRADIREIIFGNYRIIYRIRQGQVAILTVRHGKQRLPMDDLTYNARRGRLALAKGC